VAQAAQQEATTGSSARDLPRHGSRVERAGRIAVDCSADNTSGEPNVCWWRGVPAKRDSTGRRCSQAHWSRRAQPDGCPRGSASPAGTATSYLAAEVQASSPRRPREGATGTNRAQLKAKRHPGCQLAVTSTAADARRPRRPRFSRTRDHASAARHRSRMSGRPLLRPPKPNAPGHDLDSRRRFPTRAAADDNPLPPDPATVPGLSSAGRARRDPRLLQAVVGRRCRGVLTRG